MKSEPFKPGFLRTTAMGIMPMRDIERAFELIFTLDIPFWPQLPNLSFFEDMYVQASEHFPGIVVDEQRKKIYFRKEKFEKELDEFFENMEDSERLSLSEKYSLVYRKFLSMDLSSYYAIRGQVTGPVSFGFNILDEELKPIIYDEEVRPLIFEFIKRKVNLQHKELREKNERAFVWIDEPGLGYIYSGLTGYTDLHAKKDYEEFFGGIEGLKGMHLCANVDLNFLLSLNLDLLSFDAFQLEFISQEYTKAIKAFIEKGSILAFGIVPTDSSILFNVTPSWIADKLYEYFCTISSFSGLELEEIARNSLIAPARCCLRDLSGANEEEVVEKAFFCLKEVSSILRERLKFYEV